MFERLIDEIRALGRAMPGAVAAFDADGTLWRDDVGEAFLHRLVERGLVRLPGGADPYAAYEAKVAADRAAGFAWAAQLQAGLREDALMDEAHALAAEWVRPRLFAATQEVLRACSEAGLVAVVVSASPIQIVRAACPLAGVPSERCLGMTVRVRDGVCTDEIVPPLTYAEGKVSALAGAGFGPLGLAVGDSIHGDLALLSAARLAVAVGEGALAIEARGRGWFVVSG